jgi:hypothetical protein
VPRFCSTSGAASSSSEGPLSRAATKKATTDKLIALNGHGISPWPVMTTSMRKDARAKRNRLSDLSIGFGSRGGFPRRHPRYLRVLLSARLVRLAAASSPVTRISCCSPGVTHGRQHHGVASSRPHSRASRRSRTTSRSRWTVSDGFEPIRRYRRYHRLIDRFPRVWFHVFQEDSMKPFERPTHRLAVRAGSLRLPR